MAKIYTSRFSNKELETGLYTVVGVVRSMPRFPVKYRIDGNIRMIAPPGFLWNENNRERFKEPYFGHLEQSGYLLIKEAIDKYLALGKDVVLCCYEDVRKPNEWCHRLVFAEWWQEKTGQVIEELPDPSRIPCTKSRSIEKNEKTEENHQLTLFD